MTQPRVIFQLFKKQNNCEINIKVQMGLEAQQLRLRFLRPKKAQRQQQRKILPTLAQHPQSSMAFEINFKVSVIQQLTPDKDGPQKAKPIKQAQVRQNFLEGIDQITQKRQTLVQMVINQGCGLTKTAKKLNLKLSTAKLILRKYKQTGKFQIRRFRKSSVENIVAPLVKEQDEASSSKEQLENQSYQKVQQPTIHANLYPIIYSQFCYPYYGVYGVWHVNNFHQFM